MFEAHLKVILVDDFIFVCIKQIEQLEYFLIHVLVFNDAK
jgi:hypothetical protein